ncbi:hypothetical protein YC2023_055405 [Brassica napus]
MGFGEPKYVGHCAFRGLGCYPEGQPFQKNVNYIYGRELRAGYVHVSSTKVYWFICFNSPSLGDPLTLIRCSDETKSVYPLRATALSPTSAPPSSRRGSCGFGSGEARNVKRGGKLVWVDMLMVDVNMAIADDTAEGTFVWFDGVMTKLHNLRASEAVQMLVKYTSAEDGVNPEDSRIPPFIADMEGKSYTFQVRVTAYNFTSNHKTFTIT